MIDLQQISKTYTKKGESFTALQPTDLHVKTGEIFGIIGGSGAGKSTLLRCVNLLERPTSGKVRVAGEDITFYNAAKLREVRQQLGMIFQHFNLISAKTVFDNIALPLRLVGKPAGEIRKRVHDLLELVGLKDYGKAYPAALSGGQKQRVAIARALANQPKVLLSDEATSALDPQTTNSILKLLQKINQELGVTILLITHEMEVIKQICHRVAVLDKGSIIEQGDVLDIFTQPSHDTTKSFVASCMGESLPEAFLAKVKPQPTNGDKPLFHLAFRGHSAVEPLISGMVQSCGVMVNIVQAHLETIQGEACGTMMFTLFELDKSEQVKNYLSERGVHAEVIGYVANA